MYVYVMICVPTLNHRTCDKDKGKIHIESPTHEGSSWTQLRTQYLNMRKPVCLKIGWFSDSWH